MRSFGLWEQTHAGVKGIPYCMSSKTLEEMKKEAPKYLSHRIHDKLFFLIHQISVLCAK